jgi:hypothetical protein
MVPAAAEHGAIDRLHHLRCSGAVTRGGDVEI